MNSSCIQGRILCATALLAVIFGLAAAEAATISWINPAGGNWSNPTNWDAGTVPGPADTALITLGGNYSVNLDVDVTVNNLTIGGASGTQTATWVASNLVVTNFTINSNAVLSLGSGSMLNLAGTINSQGTINWGTTNALTAVGNCAVSNSGVFNLQTNFNTSGFTPFTGSPYYSGTFNSTGTFLVQSNLGSIAFLPDRMHFTNTGAINVGGGSILALRGSWMSGAGPMVFNDGTLITGPGLVQDLDGYIVANGRVNVNGTFELDGNDIQSPWEGDTGIIEGTQTWSGTGSLNWNGGLMGDIGAVADLDLVASNTTTFATNFQVNVLRGGAIVNCQIINNQGTIDWTNGSALEGIANESFFDNAGLMIFHGTCDLFGDNVFAGNVANSVINNSGTIFATSSNSANEIFLDVDSGWTFTNTGVIEVDSNIVFGIEGRTTNRMVFADGTVFNVLGMGQVNLGDAAFTSYYEFDGTITVNGLTNKYGNIYIGQMANISGTQTWTGTGSMNLDTATFYGPGVTTIAANFLINDFFATGDVTLDGHDINNEGTINVAGIGFSEVRPAAFTNSGLIVTRSLHLGVDNFVNSGTMTGPQNTYFTIDCDGNFTNSGTFYAPANSELQIHSSYVTLNDGTVFAGPGKTLLLIDPNFSDPAGTITANGNITDNGNVSLGYFATLQGTQTWSGTGSLTWSSASLTSPGTTTIASKFTLNVADDPDDVPRSVPRSLTQNHVLNNLGTVIWNSTNAVQMSNQASFVNAGLVVLQTNCGLQQMTPDCGFINLPGGTVRVLGGGNSSFSCPFTNSGTLDLESGGLSLGSGYALGASSVNQFAAGNAANVLTVPALNPAGTLSVSLPNGYPVTNSTAFTLMNYGSRSGTFPGIQLPALASSLQWKLDYGPTSLALEAVTNTTRISAPAMLPNGTFQFTFNGPAANNYWIQASTNLMDWITVQTESPFTGQSGFTDLAATNFSRRFYRGVTGN